MAGEARLVVEQQGKSDGHQTLSGRLDNADGIRLSELVPAVPADSELISETESGEVQCESGMNEGEPRYTSE